MSVFNDFLSGLYPQALGILGATAFTLRGVSYSGSKDELSDEQRLEIGNLVKNARCTLLVAKSAFGAVVPLIGERLTLTADSRTLRIGHIEVDEVFSTLTLQDIQG